MNVSINPSILNANIINLQAELARIKNADMVHVDVMDNHFVPNLSWGLPVVEAVVREQTLPVDAHLMIADADRWAPFYAQAGCASVTFHVEAAQAPVRLARQLHRYGSKAGLALRPATPIESCLDVLSEFEMILIMTVEPGFGGQSFIEPMLVKISRLRNIIQTDSLPLAIQVDGGVNKETIVQAAQAGANVFVAGSAIFTAEDAYAQVEQLRALAQQHAH